MRKMFVLIFISTMCVSSFLYAQDTKDSQNSQDKSRIDQLIMSERMRLISKYYGKYLYNKSENQKIIYSLFGKGPKLELTIETPEAVFISRFSKFDEETIIFYSFESFEKGDLITTDEKNKNLPDEVYLNMSAGEKKLIIKQKMMDGTTTDITADKFITYFGRKKEITTLLLPLQEGYKYVYKSIIDGKITDKSKTIIVSVKGKEIIMERDRYAVETLFPDNSMERVFYGKTTLGLYRYDTEGPEKGFKILPLPLKTDSKWEPGKIEKEDSGKIIKMEANVEGLDYVITEDGVFECFKIREKPIDDKDNGKEEYLWVAPAVGIIQFTRMEDSEENEETIYRLVKFSFKEGIIFPK